MSNPLESWTEEQRSAYLYRACADAEAGTPRADLFTRLAGEAEAQAAIWRAQLTASGKPAPRPFVPELRTRLVARLVGLFGPRPLRAILAAMKVRGMVIYSAKGLSAVEADRVAKQLISDPEHALDTLAREELGLNPDELGSPWGAAVSSLLSFAVGAVVPLLPFVFGAGARALPISALLTALALFGVGATLSLFTGRSAFFSGARMMLLGGLAAAVTFGVGRLFGVSVT